MKTKTIRILQFIFIVVLSIWCYMFVIDSQRNRDENDFFGGKKAPSEQEAINIEEQVKIIVE